MNDQFKIEDLKKFRNELENLKLPPIIGRSGRAYYKIAIHESWVSIIAQEAVAITEEGELHAEFPCAKYRWRDFLIYDDFKSMAF